MADRKRYGKREREQAEDEKQLTLHLMLQAFIGSGLAIECHDGAVATGTLVSADSQMK